MDTSNLNIEKFETLLIEKSSRQGSLDEDAFIVEQANLPFEVKGPIRYSQKLAKLYFNLVGLEGVQTDYYFWDNTTLCMKAPLLEYVGNGEQVLEIGCGPAATMSVFLLKSKQGLSVTCAELNAEFIRSAQQIAKNNGVAPKIIQSDMTSNIQGSFDVVLMNPPYVKAHTIAEFGIERKSGEGRAGFSGDDGCMILDKFLAEVPRVLTKGGRALLGINNRYLEDSTIEDRVAKSALRLKSRYYSESKVHPNGPYSQVYVLTH